ncbi:DUF45 domain-containing protein [Gloeomargaritales cyanobacterium VI4D9]|nr:DUF45 domain-containing protein [Gloeomargaritales cyanobacterium VI4D9]
MIETIPLQIGEISITLILKDVKNVHLSVHPPDGRVTLVAPLSTRVDVARAYAISKLAWIRAQQNKFLNQEREIPRQFVERESHYLWGQRYLLTIVYNDAKPFVKLDHKRITLSVRPNSNIREPLFIVFCTDTESLEAPFSRWQLSIMQGSFSIAMN